MQKIKSFFIILVLFCILVACDKKKGESSTESLKTKTGEQSKIISDTNKKAISETKKSTPIKEQTKINNNKLQKFNIKKMSAQTLKKKNVLFAKDFYPYFQKRGEVPYLIKIKLEKIIPKMKVILKKQPKSLIVIKGYVSIKENYELKEFLSYWRAYESASYLAWKMNLPLKKFRIIGEIVSNGDTGKLRKVKVMVIL